MTHGAAAFGGSARAPATFVLIAINVAVYLAEIASGPGGAQHARRALVNNYGLIGTSVAGGEWYRLLTGGFLHAGLTHIGFNMVALYFLGRLLEPAIGTTALRLRLLRVAVRGLLRSAPAERPGSSSRSAPRGRSSASSARHS